MTVIVAARDRKTNCTWIASDRRCSSGDWFMDNQPKWVVRGQWAIGVAGALRVINLMEAHFAKLIGEAETIFDFSCALRETMKADGILGNATNDGPGTPSFGQYMVLASPQGIWEIGCDLAFAAVPDGVAALGGSGSEVGSGAAHALMRLRVPLASRRAMLMIVQAAVANSASCGGEPWVHCLREPRRGPA